jgi:hypothetical protein
VPDYEDRLTKFERMCVVKAFREDRTLIAAADYIADALGQRFVESVPLSMERAWGESHRKCPLICLLSPGAAQGHRRGMHVAAGAVTPCIWLHGGRQVACSWPTRALLGCAL